MSFEIAQARRKQTGRNDVCPCGSGVKYKKCHQNEDDALIAAELKRVAEAAEAAAKAEAEAKAEEEGDETKAEARDRARPRGHAKSGADKRVATRGVAAGKAQNLPRRGAV
jgi:SEC-C motif